MPQVTGNATWLTNTRRENEAPHKSIGIDHSNVRIENEAHEEKMVKELDEIHIQAHRAMADRTFDLNETRKDVQNYQKIKALSTQKHHLDALLEKRKLDAMVNYGGAGHSHTAALKGNKEATTSSNSMTKTQRRPKTGFSRIVLDDSDDDDLYYKRQQKNDVTSSTTVYEPQTTAHPSRHRRRPKTSQPARSLRQIRQALEDEFPSSTRQRPKTSVGFSRDQDEIGDAHTSGNTPGRSFIELREITHIDHLHTARQQEKLDYMHELRNRRLKLEKLKLQNKLDQFYERIEQFKTDSKKHILSTQVLY